MEIFSDKEKELSTCVDMQNAIYFGTIPRFKKNIGRSKGLHGPL